MAGISSGGGHGGKKSLDSEIPLVPFIDLLLCCVMFLLVTAVWNQLSRINANQQTPGQAQTALPPEQKVRTYVKVKESGYNIVATGLGVLKEIATNGERDGKPVYDREALMEFLKERKTQDPTRKDIIIVPDDGTSYVSTIDAMDTAIGAGFKDVTIADSAPL